MKNIINLLFHKQKEQKITEEDAKKLIFDYNQNLTLKGLKKIRPAIVPLDLLVKVTRGR